MSCAWVAPVTLANGTSAVLKLGMPHMEGEHEIEGLRFWNGDPTVRLLEASRDLGAMLLERCEPGTALLALPEPEQDLVDYSASGKKEHAYLFSCAVLVVDGFLPLMYFSYHAR